MTLQRDEAVWGAIGIICMTVFVLLLFMGLTGCEGVNLDRHYTYDNSCGEIMGPREEFTGRIGYVFQVPHK